MQYGTLSITSTITTSPFFLCDCSFLFHSFWLNNKISIGNRLGQSDSLQLGCQFKLLANFECLLIRNLFSYFMITCHSMPSFFEFLSQELRDLFGGVEFFQLSQLKNRIAAHLLPSKAIQVDYNVTTTNYQGGNK